MTSAVRWIALAGIVLVALVLRTYDLDRRPMHADEANQAVKTGELIESGTYAFDAHDHHGPTLYFAALPVAWIRGQHTLASLTETTVRIVPALFGTLAVLAVAGIGGVRNRGVALLAAALLAVSPPAVYYSRYYIQEMLLVAFTLWAVIAGSQWWRTRQTRWAVATGTAVGLMLATKESAIVLVVAAAIAALSTEKWARGRSDAAGATHETSASTAAGARPMRWSDVLLGITALVVVAALLYSSFGRDPGGVWRALLAPLGGLHRAVVEPRGHEKPWRYYLQLLTWNRSGGLVFEQVLFSTLAVMGVIAAFVRRENRWAQGAALYVAVVLVALSIAPYKTPWNVIHVLPPMAFLGGYGLVTVVRLRTGRLVAAAFAFLTFATLLSQVRLVAFRRAADERNPYAYVHSSPDVLKYRPLAEAALAADPGAPIRVISEEYWPLPWYLRGLPRIGYWTSPPADCDGALVIASADLAPTVAARLHGPHHQKYLGLRPGFVCVVFTPEPPKSPPAPTRGILLLSNPSGPSRRLRPGRGLGHEYASKSDGMLTPRNLPVRTSASFARRSLRSP